MLTAPVGRSCLRRADILKRFLFGSLLFGLAFLSFAQSPVLKVAVGLTLPPYVIEDQKRGIEVDILKQALPGYDIQLLFVPFARVPLALSDGSAQVALTINENSGLKDVYYSDVHITYQNVVVTLKSRNLAMNSIADLAPLITAAFQNARQYLGPEFAAMAAANRRYTEVPQQLAQVKLLFLKRADALVSDINIFQYFRNTIKDIDVSAPVVVSELFSPTPYKVGFQSAALRDQFNAGLKSLRASGKYDQILASYLK